MFILVYVINMYVLIFAKTLIRDKKYLLIVSCPSATKFSAMFLYHLAQSSSNSPRSFEGFKTNSGQNFNWIRQQMTNFPHRPHCKIRPLSATLWRCRKRASFIMGSMGKVFTRCRIWMKFCLSVRLKLSNDRGEFELDWARCYKKTPKIRLRWDIKRTMTM